ncbi:BamA/TamA family outer membrane protein [Pedobacter alpinus]|uniref:BamA/TamA family outer membrane protein n=1 Tax=Pedobacter alpinus TaxID=1590643 RepID=A0ABW5TPQ3_9SPHI
MKKIFFLTIALLGSINCTAQKKLIEKLFSSDTTRHNSFFPVPLIGYTQEAGFEFGAVGIYSFYLDKTDSTIRASQIYGVAFTSTKGVSQISSKADIWTKGNKWHQLYEARFSNIPFNFYGLGSNTSKADEDLVVQTRWRVGAEIEKQFTKSYYPGVGFEFESVNFKDDEPGGIFDLENQANLIDKDGGRYVFLKITQLLDTRNSNTYTTKGFYGRFRYAYAPDFFGGNNFKGNLFTTDLRYFKSVNKKLVLGNQLFYEAVTSKKDIPFYMLRQMGNDQIMRGYYLGRYRDKNYMALQAELRYKIINRFGMAAFGGVGSVYNRGFLPQQNFKPSYGLGARIFFDLEKSLALRVDYAWGEKPMGEKRISGFYISLGEAF